ncbi:MAG: BREX-1 system adenine-specific DNA-methyltransferase PglX [Halieaceae bacterium]|nr:BREX-1 system adenine-specific DNA-methyltransferase PglX [Halieaceae bacterium]
MNTKPLEKFAQSARRQLHEQVAAKLARVLRPDSIERRAKPEAIAELEAQIAQSSRDAVIERVAYTWFNRFSALHYMDVNGYTRMGVLSPATGFTQPEMLQEAKQGYIDPDLPVDQETIFGLLNGRLPSPDPQGEVYRLLLVGACNYYHRVMPFMFERIDDYTELLMPDDLLSAESILQATRDALTPDACQDVEVIGWLYQFYISEKKDAVFASKKKIAGEDIPAATQLFTPHWIVRYLVENSLGRLWLLNRPHSQLAEQMDYYIEPEEAESDFLRVGSAEELRVLDPAVGSGHMLTYAFDLLYAIYEEEGYNTPDIPRLILTQNLVGIEIDERAAALAAFALTMKARAKDRRFFRRDVRPNITVLQPVQASEEELADAPWLKQLGTNLVDLPLRDALLQDLQQFEQVDNIGSLLRPQLTLEQITELRQRIQAASDLFSADLNQRVQQVLAQLAVLARRYHVVIANPPYMNSSNANAQLKSFLNSDYKDVKSDLFSAFIGRNTELALPKGQLGFMTPFVWMFISSYEKLRNFLIERKTITSLIQLEYSGFAGATVPICTFTLENAPHPDFKGGYVRLSDFRGADHQAPKALEAIRNPDCGWFYRASAADFKKIPGAPIAYWLRHFEVFDRRKIGDVFISAGRLKTHDGPKYIRYNWEIARSNQRWQRIIKGGEFRKYFGHEEFVADWSQNAIEFYRTMGGLPPEKYLSKKGICWSKITSSSTSFRIKNAYTEYDAASPTILIDSENSLSYEAVLAYLNSFVTRFLLAGLNPTLNTQVGDVLSLPLSPASEFSGFEQEITNSTFLLVDHAKTDWDAYETSWDFSDLPLLRPDFRRGTLTATYAAVRARWRELTLEMQQLEEENNRLFIDAYGLQEELTPDVPLKEITLTCNPHYRYRGKKSEEKLEALLLADTMREFISYAVGCMFGRYSLDKPGLILANQGETLEDYLRQVPHPTFQPDKDNAIPMLDGNWFEDDIVDRFKLFLRVTFGKERYEENLAFIETALGKDIRRYFLREFYPDHVRRYKKRPIYWLFSSPKGSFNVLIYMHRYRPDTISVVLNDYLRQFRAKLSARKAHLDGVERSPSASRRDKSAAIKEIDKLAKALNELNDYENDILYPLATRQIQIDLDDGVKVNYKKFGRALKKVAGLS